MYAQQSFQYTGVIFLVVPILTKLTGYLPTITTTHPTPPTHRTLPSSHYHYYHTPHPPTHRTLPSSHYHYYHPPHTHLTHPTPPTHRSPPPRPYKFPFKRSEMPLNVYRRNVRMAANQISPIESVRSSAQPMTLLRLLVT